MSQNAPPKEKTVLRRERKLRGHRREAEPEDGPIRRDPHRGRGSGKHRVMGFLRVSALLSRAGGTLKKTEMAKTRPPMRPTFPLRFKLAGRNLIT
jgi:hypothetical protein